MVEGFAKLVFSFTITGGTGPKITGDSEIFRGGKTGAPFSIRGVERWIGMD
jgi:hypothetical protein